MERRFSLILLLIFFCYFEPLHGRESSSPLIGIGGGYFDAGSNHSGGLFQIEYRFANELFWLAKPQAILITSRFRSIFLGLGIGVDLYTTKHLVMTPSFIPGVYCKGSGKDLGYPLEFRSSLELAYEWCCKARLSGQFYHISNASLSKKNPGANALALIFCIPFKR